MKKVIYNFQEFWNNISVRFLYKAFIKNGCWDGGGDGTIISWV